MRHLAPPGLPECEPARAAPPAGGEVLRPPAPDLQKKDVAGGMERPAEHPVDERVDAHRRHRAVPWEDYRWHCVAKSAEGTLR